MFDINGSHIVELSDSDLRILVARLCESELRLAGLPISAITAGGDQNAPDGGLDVRVDLPSSSSVSGFIPRLVTGFQVKVPDMPRGAIIKEMCPNGEARQVIQELAAVSGAYIIVSAKGSTSDSVLRNRCKAMREAIASINEPEALLLDFYDRDRLATWVRQHPGLITWVREKVGRPIRGWRPYASWAAPCENVETEYLLDDKGRLLDWRSPKEGPLTIVEGVNRIRGVLNQPTGIVRLVGLSGTGKTRLIQVLFDKRIGDQVLDPSLAIYTDLADQPDPSPRDLIHRLVQSGQRAIIVVDNCPPETHRALADICRNQVSSLSLITVEYDVGDDDPEGTEVFRLETSSDEVIEHLLERQAPQTSQVDRRCIAEFSGGNARIALALAHTVRRGESVANLTNKELFERLFHQRNPKDPCLLRAAEACALVYSFNGEALKGETAELPLLAELAGLTVDELYRCVSELRRRDLIQSRGMWRAVLPQALANRLAKQALDGIPLERISSIFLENASERLLKSFSRRLGYLHDSEIAQRIIQRWLSKGGLLSNLPSPNEFQNAIFRNVAAVLPEATLSALESAANGENGSQMLSDSNWERNTWTSIVKSIAYDPDLFERAAMLLARFFMAEPPHQNYNSARDIFLNLFQLYLSGSHASIEQRLQVVDTLIRSKDAASQTCGIVALERLLESQHCQSALKIDPPSASKIDPPQAVVFSSLPSF